MAKSVIRADAALWQPSPGQLGVPAFCRRQGRPPQPSPCPPLRWPGRAATPTAAAPAPARACTRHPPPAPPPGAAACAAGPAAAAGGSRRARARPGPGPPPFLAPARAFRPPQPAAAPRRHQPCAPFASQRAGLRAWPVATACRRPRRRGSWPRAAAARPARQRPQRRCRWLREAQRRAPGGGSGWVGCVCVYVWWCVCGGVSSCNNARARDIRMHACRHACRRRRRLL